MELCKRNYHTHKRNNYVTSSDWFVIRFTWFSMRNYSSTFSQNFLSKAQSKFYSIIRLFTDQLEMSALPAGCFGIDRL